MTELNFKRCPTLDETIVFAVKVHANQIDKGGQPYIIHVVSVMIGLGPFATLEERIVALLHDVVEDSEGRVTLDTLREMGYTEEIVQAVDSLTKRPDEKGDDGYFRAINRVAENPIGRKVKISDLGNNTLPSRNLNPTDKDKKRLEKYMKALVYLQRIELEYINGKRHHAPVATVHLN